MKRILFMVLLSFLLLIGCGNVNDVTEIEAVNLQNGDNIIIPIDSRDADIILEAINKKVKTDEDISSLLNYEITLKKNNEQEAYKIYFDLENQAAYLAKDDKLYKIKDNAAKKLLLSDVFSYVYVDATIYDSYVDINGKKISPYIEYSWNSKNINGHFVSSAGTLTGKYEKNSKIPVSQSELIDVKYEKQPDNQSIKVYSEGNLINSGTNIKDVLSNIKYDGEYLVECHGQWHLKEGSRFYGNQTLKFNALIDRPADINIITRENYPGNILLISVENLNEDEDVTITTDAVKIDNDIYAYKDKNYYIFPIDLYAKPGEYKVSAVINKGRSNEYTVEKTLTVADKSFKTQYLTVSEEMNETNNDNAAIFEFAQLVKPARTESAKEKLWEGTFIMPVEGELTTDFAEIRYVNNELSSSRHSGLDLAAPTGTPVKAPNNGIVTFSMEGLLSPGNTAVIDHGMGIFTSYYHLNTINVEKGDEVKKGDIIGTVGTTGFSTGPHLHYAVSIYNTYVNPYQTLSGIID
jgi:murein DD-endopeptidase MepM/ murein hydrolase activator NlpD